MKPERNEDQEYFTIPVHLASSENTPNFIVDPIEIIEAWIKKHLPEDLQSTTLEKIIELREKGGKKD